MSKRPGPGRPREFDEDQVVERAMHLFWRDGYVGTSLSELLEATGIGRASLYRTFDDKRGLFLRSFAQYQRMILARLEATLADPGGPLAGLRALIEMWRAQAHTADYAGCLLFNSLGELGTSPDAELRAICQQAVAQVEERMAGAFGAAVAAGELPAHFEVRRSTHALLGTAAAVIHFGRGPGRPDVVDGILDTALTLLRG